MSSNPPPFSTLSKSIRRRFRQFSPRYWRHYIPKGAVTPKRRGYFSPKGKAVGLTTESRRELSRRGASLPKTIGHYQDYLKRPFHPRGLTPRGRGRPRGAGRVPMGELGPDTIFEFNMREIIKDGIKEFSILVYNDIKREFHRFVKNVVTYIQTELIGDPRGYGGKKGLVPRGGTGYMRFISRSYVESQIRINRDFPFRLNVKIPVKYAKPVNAMTTPQVRHTGQYGWRIVDYTPSGSKLKARYKKIRLDDPKATGGFYETLIERARIYAATRFVATLKRVVKYNKSTLVNALDVLDRPIRIQIDSFMYYPLEFSNLIL